ncbi:MAG: diguanylate cyclase, partial [Cyanobacteria bacterium J06641_5]
MLEPCSTAIGWFVGHRIAIARHNPMSDKPVILCIDNEADALESLRAELQALEEECTVEGALGAEEALELFDDLQSEGFEVALVLSGYLLSGLKGDELLERIHQRSPQTLKIMLSAQADAKAIGNALRNAHLHRYVAKPWQPEELRLTVTEALQNYLQAKQAREEVRQIRQANRDLEELAQRQAAIIAERTAELEAARVEIERAERELRCLVVTDDLTQLANQRHFDKRLEQEWLRLARTGEPLGLILCDVDSLQQYNELYGKASGDRCLQQIAQALTGVVRRSGDLVARHSDRIFAMLLPSTGLPGVEQVAERILLAVSELEIAYPESAVSDRITVSLGAACQTPIPEFSSPTQILAAAE